jgi:hypothetical protein
MDKECPNCKENIPRSQLKCDCGLEFDFYNPLAPKPGQIGFDFSLEPTIGLGSGLSMDFDGDLNIFGVNLTGD